jgi:uncharacterized damage-inducible protein DinB
MTIPEVQAYLTQLRDLRAELLKWCDSLPADALNWRPLAHPLKGTEPITDTNSIYVMATHVIGSEAWWLQQIIGGMDVHRNRDAEFVATGDDLAALLVRLNAVAMQSETVLSKLAEADLDGERDTTLGKHTVRWCILHVIEHTSRHIGHIELTRQLWENQKK